jgi:hypothetical protein
MRGGWNFFFEVRLPVVLVLVERQPLGVCWFLVLIMLIVAAFCFYQTITASKAIFKEILSYLWLKIRRSQSKRKLD